MTKFSRFIFILPLIISLFAFNASAAGLQLPSDLDDDTLFLAATLWGEAKDDSAGMQVVANTILNRKKYYEQQSNGEKKLSIKDIISDTDQFASWKGKSWDTASIIKNMADYEGTDKAKWETCLNIAKQALSGKLVDITGGATGYYSKDAETVPEWARGNTNVETISDKVVVRGANAENSANSNNATVAGGSSYQSDFKSTQINSETSGETCNGIESPLRDISANPSGYGIVSERSITNMNDMLERIYKNLGRVFMLGHGLFCYAQKVAYTCVGVDVPILPSACAIKIPSMSYLFCGLAIYFTAFLISIAIGMYFIDICFKLGFAVIYLPIAIALWPFAPTKSKFMEVFGIILHSAMLYTMLSIGLTYGILLIYNGVLGDVSNWTSFWNAIEQESSEILAENFSLTATRTIVILFCLIFGFKIIRSSVDNYLNSFFSDNITGGESPMHYLGTQALGMTVGAITGTAGSYLKDVAVTQTGRGIQGIGNAMIKGGEVISGEANKISDSFLQKAQSGEYGTVAQRRATTFNQYVDRFNDDDFAKKPSSTGDQSGTTARTTNNASSAENPNTLDANNSSADGTTTSTNSLQNQQHTDNSDSANATQIANFVTSVDENTLRPSNIISKTSSFLGSGISAALHPQKTFNTLKNLSTQGVSSENSLYQNGKLIFTNTGKVLFRKFTPNTIQAGLSSENSFAQNAEILAQNTAVSAAQTARGTIGDVFIHTGNIFSRMGKSMQQNNSSNGHSSNWYSKQQEQRELEEEEARLQGLVDETMDMDD